jgi:hypothetical protein
MPIFLSVEFTRLSCQREQTAMERHDTGGFSHCSILDVHLL